MGSFCGGEGVAYQEMIPPETRDYRADLYNYLGQPTQWARGASKYEGQLPYTGQPDYSQLAGMNAILSMLGYGPWKGQAIPPNATDSALGGGNYPATDTHKYDPWHYGYPFDELTDDPGGLGDPGDENDDLMRIQDPYAPRR